MTIQQYEILEQVDAYKASEGTDFTRTIQTAKELVISEETKSLSFPKNKEQYMDIHNQLLSLGAGLKDEAIQKAQKEILSQAEVDTAFLANLRIVTLNQINKMETETDIKRKPFNDKRIPKERNMLQVLDFVLGQKLPVMDQVEPQ